MPSKNTVFLFRLTDKEQESILKNPPVSFQKQTETDEAPDLIVKICGRCRTHNDADAVFCKKCGKKFFSNTVTADSTPAPISEETDIVSIPAYIEQQENDNNAALPEQTVSSPVKIKKKKAIIAAVAIALAAAVFLGIFITIKIVEKSSYDRAVGNAVKIETACEDYYAGVISGVLYNDSAGAASIVSDTIPERYVSISTRKSISKQLTVAGALEYAGLTELKSSINEYYYSSIGGKTATNVYYYLDPNKPSDSKILTLTTTMEELFDL